MSNFNRVSPTFHNVAYIQDEVYVPPLSQVHHFSAVEVDTLPPDPGNDFNLLPAALQPGYEDIVMQPQFWDAANDTLHLFDPINFNVIAMNVQMMRF